MEYTYQAVNEQAILPLPPSYESESHSREASLECSVSTCSIPLYTTRPSPHFRGLTNPARSSTALILPPTAAASKLSSRRASTYPGPIILPPNDFAAAFQKSLSNSEVATKIRQRPPTPPPRSWNKVQKGLDLTPIRMLTTPTSSHTDERAEGSLILWRQTYAQTSSSTQSFTISPGGQDLREYHRSERYPSPSSS